MKFKDDPKYKRIKGEFLSLDLVIPGTIRETYLHCGKKECACSAKDGTPHGPYYFWNRKVNGKLTSKSISPDKLQLFQVWIKNREMLEALVNQVLEFGQEIAASLPSKTEEEKSKKRASAKRGK